MEKSQSIIELSKALVKFQSKMKSITKDAVNPFFKSKYATLENIWSEIRQPLVECGLSVSQLPSENGLITILMHESGEYLMTEAKLNLNVEPQKAGSAITYMRRYALSAVLGLVTDEDDDGNNTVRTAQNDPKLASGSFVEPETSVSSFMQEEAPTCTKCGAITKWKSGVAKKTGKSYGFWGCSAKNPDGTWCNTIVNPAKKYQELPTINIDDNSEPFL